MEKRFDMEVNHSGADGERQISEMLPEKKDTTLMFDSIYHKKDSEISILKSVKDKDGISLVKSSKALDDAYDDVDDLLGDSSDEDEDIDKLSNANLISIPTVKKISTALLPPTPVKVNPVPPKPIASNEPSRKK